MRNLLIGLFLLGSGVGCQTQFLGDPHISPAQCQARCAQSNLQMAGMVYMGEYSSACICEVGKAGAATSLASAGAVGAAPGVVMQMRRAAAASSTMPPPAPRR
jgi:hypothetical protein